MVAFVICLLNGFQAMAVNPRAYPRKWVFNCDLDILIKFQKIYKISILDMVQTAVVFRVVDNGAILPIPT